MSSSELDTYPVSDLEKRYQISRSMMYVRMKALGIAPEKQGKRGFLNAEQISLMDKLHNHIEEGGMIADFPELPNYPPSEEVNALTELKELEEKPLLDAEIMKLASLPDLLEIFKPSAIDTKFKHLEHMEKAAQNGWILSTPDLCELLGVNSIPSNDFSRYGFSFKRHGRNGKYGAWKVIKSGD